MDAWSARAKSYDEQLRSFQTEAEALIRDYDTLTKHPAFPNASRKLQETRARIMVDGTDQEDRSLTAMFQGMTLEEIKVVNAMTQFSLRLSQLNEIRDSLERQRRTLLAEWDELARVIARHQMLMYSVGAWYTYHALQQPPVSSLRNCVTQYVGRTAFMNC